MGKFLKMLWIWGLVFLALCLCLDLMVSSGLRRTDIRKYAVWNDIYASRIDADVIIMGSSETWCGYNPEIIDSLLNVRSYNLAIDGHGFKYQQLRYEVFRRFNPKPKLLIMNVDYPGTFDANSGYGYEREQFFPYITDGTLIASVAGDKQITWKERFIPLFRYYGYREEIENGIGAFFGKKSFKDGGLRKGFRGNAYLWSPESLATEGVFHCPVDREVISSLDAFVQARLEEGINVVFVEFPEYYRLRDKFDNVEEVERIFARIAEKNHVLFINCSEWPVSRDSSWYYNSSHLNKAGADLFTSMLCDTIAKQSLAQRESLL